MYGKIFEQMFDSTINELPTHVRFVWIALIVIAGKNGIIDKTPEAIARQINVPLAEVEEAIATLSQPDQRSRSGDQEGRRIVPIREGQKQFGWLIVNHAKYRKMQREDDRREYQRLLMKERRAQGKDEMKGPSRSDQWLRMEARKIRTNPLMMQMKEHDPEEYAEEVRDRTGYSPEELAALVEDDVLSLSGVSESPAGDDDE